MFDVSDGINFTLDEHLRLRIAVPDELRPLAAWLHTDIQANHDFLGQLIPGLRSAQLAGTTVIGNGWDIEPSENGVTLHARYVPREPVFVPDSLLWPVLEGLHGFLGGIDAQLHADNPPAQHDIVRFAEPEEPGVVRDHSYFPPSWTNEQVAEAGQGAWQSTELVFDESTGAWSGFWQGMEIAGYYDPASGEVRTYFPVLSPLNNLPVPA